MEEKQKKIDELKAVLAEAKVRLETYRSEIELKDKKIEQLSARLKKAEKQQEKIKLLQNDSSQIMQQYQSRLSRYQLTLQQHQKIIQTHQKQNQILTANNKNLSLNIQKLTNIVRKATLQPSKQATESIQQLFSLQKLKQSSSQIQKVVFLQKGVDQLRKSITQFISSVMGYLERKREGRLNTVKREMTLRKEIEGVEEQVRVREEEIARLREEGKRKVIEHKKELDLQRHQYSKKIPKEEFNVEYIKNMVVKVFTAPVDVARMSLKVLQNILKITPQQYKQIQKKIK